MAEIIINVININDIIYVDAKQFKKGPRLASYQHEEFQKILTHSINIISVTAKKYRIVEGPQWAIE